MQYYLGLDISTSCTGITILNSAGVLEELTYISTNKEKSLFCKAKMIKNKLLEISSVWKISEVFVEENLQSFSTGMSSARTLLQLARINGIVSFCCYEIFGLEPIFLNVNSVRKQCQMPIDRKSGVKIKEQVFQWVKQQLPTFEWPTKVLSRGPTKGNVKLMECCYDMSDSYVIAYGGYILKNKRDIVDTSSGKKTKSNRKSLRS